MKDLGAELPQSPPGEPTVAKALKTAKILAEAAKAQGAPPAEATELSMSAATQGTAPADKSDDNPLR